MPFTNEANQHFHICCSGKPTRRYVNICNNLSQGSAKACLDLSKIKTHIEENAHVYTRVTYVSDEVGGHFKNRCQFHKLQKDRSQNVRLAPRVAAKCLRRHRSAFEALGNSVLLVDTYQRGHTWGCWISGFTCGKARVPPHVTRWNVTRYTSHVTRYTSRAWGMHFRHNWLWTCFPYLFEALTLPIASHQECYNLL